MRVDVEGESGSSEPFPCRRFPPVGSDLDRLAADADQDIGRSGHQEPGLLGARDDRRATSEGFGVDRVPEARVVVRVLVDDVPVDLRLDRDGGRSVEWGDPVPEDPEVLPGHRDEPNGVDRHRAPVRQRRSDMAFELARLHVQDSSVVGDVRRCQIEGLTVDGDVERLPIRRIEHLREVVGVAVLPPPHAGRIGVVDAGEIVAAQRVARVPLLVVPASTEVAVPEAEQALEHALLCGVEPGLHHRPRIVRHQMLHEDED